MPPSSLDSSKIASLVKKVMATGHTVRTEAGAYFVPIAGRPMPVHVRPGAGVGAFAGFVAATCQISPRSKMATAVIGRVETLAFRNPNITTVTQSIDATAGQGSEQHYLINTGGCCIIELLPDGSRRRVPNGTYGVLFTDPLGFEPVGMTDEQIAWEGGGHSSFLLNLITDRLPPPTGSLTLREVAALVLAAWFTPFISSLITGKPIWLFLGGPGVGKSTTQKVMACAFYGGRGNTTGSVGHDRGGKDLFAAAAQQPVVFRDDANRFSADLLDSICQLSTGMTVALSRLYEDLELALFDAKATFILSAYAPQWLGRLDVMQRLITIELGHPGNSDGLTTGDRLRNTLGARPWLWAETLLVLARARAMPRPSRSPVRFDDWHGIIRNVLASYGMESDFDSALGKLDAERVRLACASEPAVAAVAALASNPFWGTHWSSAATLLDQMSANDGVEAREGDPHRATSVLRDPQKMALLLRKLMTDFSGVVRVAVRMGPNHANEYRIWPANQPDPLAIP
jgi:hypothetical protein